MARGERVIPWESRLRGWRSRRRESQLVETFTEPILESHCGQRGQILLLQVQTPTQVSMSSVGGGGQVVNESVSCQRFSKVPPEPDNTHANDSLRHRSMTQATRQSGRGKSQNCRVDICACLCVVGLVGWRCACRAPSKGSREGLRGGGDDLRSRKGSNSHNERLERAVGERLIEQSNGCLHLGILWVSPKKNLVVYLRPCGD